MEVKKSLEKPGLTIHNFVAGELFEFGEAENVYLRVEAFGGIGTAAVRLSDGFVYGGPWDGELKRCKGFVQMEN